MTLLPSVPYLQRWLSDHPARDDPAAPLRCKLNHPEAFSYRMFTKILEQAAKAGVDKPVTFTNFRKSSASYLASQGTNQAHIEDHYGWVRRVQARPEEAATIATRAHDRIANYNDTRNEEDDRFVQIEDELNGLKEATFTFNAIRIEDT